jgi:murein L,D-transpeptidase YcbB/YkuD
MECPFQIATKDILPILQRNPAYLEKNNYEVYDSWNANAKLVNPYGVNWQAVNAANFKYRIVQKANKKNALGAVKFLFPNALNIYIHDTPAKHLFKENKRAYSHGCIRLENPAKLAACLLRNDPTWTQEKIQEQVNTTQSAKVTLSEPVKLEIMYLTAFVENGVLQFRDDIYRYDQP